MEKIYKLAFLILSSTFFNQTAFAQYQNATWTSSGPCSGTEPEIVKIFVDACFGTGTTEGLNEFVYMKTGASGWDYSNFSMEGGTGQNAGLTNLAVATNFGPASNAIINNLNAGVGPCAAGTTYFAGTNPLPANATVMVYPSGVGTTVPANAVSYMCGKGPIYVITDGFVPGGIHGAFFRNGNAGGTNKTSIFNFGTCKKTVVYSSNSSNPNPGFPPDQGATNIGGYILGPTSTPGPPGKVGLSECFEAAPCVGLPSPNISNPTIEICESSSIPSGTTFNCTNCTGNISIYASATAVYPIYVGPSFPTPSFFPPNITTTYYIEQSGFCPSAKIPVTLQVNPAPQNLPSVSATTLTCAAPTITITPGSTSQGANFTYQWAGPNGFTSTSLTPTITQGGGLYSLTVTNTTTGCTKTVQVGPITDNTAFPQITPTPDKTINCITPAPISIGATSSTAGVTYTWSNGVNTAVQAVNTGGTFIVSVTNPNNGCTKKDTVVVTLDNTPPTVNPIAAVTVNCTTPTPTLTAVASGGSGLTYSWSPGGGTNSNLSISTGGTYTVTVTNPTNGCKTPQSITISEDKIEPTVVIATPDKLNCINNSIVTLNTAGTSTGANFTYNWSGPGGFSSSAVTPPDVTVAGTYSVTVTNTTNGCTKVASVTVMDDKVLPTADAGADKILNCINNQSVTIGGASSAGANFTYLWSNGNTAATQTVTTAGTYTITVTNTTNGCTKTDDVTVTQDIVAPVISPIPAVTVNCFTPTPTLNTTVTGSNLVYAWSPSGSGATPTISVGGTYTVTVTNSVNGCTDVESITVPEDKVDPTAVIAAPGILNCTNNSSISLNASGTSTGANFTYNWSGPGGYTSNAIPPPNATVAGTYSLTVSNTTNGCTKVVSTTVTEDKVLPTADAGADKVLNCINNQSVTIGGASSVGANFTYLWSNGNAAATQTVTTAGTYTITVTNTTNGCTKSDDVTVTQDIVAPVISPIPAVTVNCFTPTPTLNTTVTGSNLVYAWSPSGSGTNPTISAGGTYTVTVTNSVNGCKDVKSITVPEDKVDPTATIATPAVLTCTNNSSIVLNATGTSTGANFTYNWSGPGGFSGSTIPPPNATAPGAYSLTVTNTTNGCTKIATTTVTQNTTQPTLANMAPQVLTCTNNGQVTIGGTATGGTNFTYLWSNGSSSATQTVTTPNTYTVTVTNTDNGCTQSASVTITEDKVIPTVDAGPDLTINCTNPTANASATASGGTPLTYNWSGAASGGNTLTPTFNTGGTYTLTVTNTTNGCTKTDDITVTSDKVDPTAVAVTSNGINCTNTTATLNVTGSSTGANFTYAWSGPNSFSNNTPNPSVTVGGNYTLTVTNTINGCTKTATVNVAEDKTLPNASISNAPQLTCSNPSIQLSGTGSTGANFTYNWVASAGGTITAGATTLTPTVTTAGTYSLTVTNTTNGCTKDVSVNVTEDKVAPVVNATGAGTITCTNPTLNLGVNVTSGSNLQYQWTASAGGSISGNPNQQNIVATQGGTYTVTVTNATNGCTTTSSVNVTANNTPPTTNATASGTIDCNNTSITIDGSSSSQGANFTYVWTGPGGYNNTTTLSPSVTVGGAYTLSITNTSNGCTGTKSVVVSENKTPPTVSINQPNSLTCTVFTTSISAVGNATNLYSWTASAGGNIVGSSSGQTINVDKAGTYTVNVINPTNGCQATANTSVSENKNLPTVVIASPSAINCTNPIATINASGSSTGANFQYAWTASPGVVLTGQGTSQITTNQAGSYTLSITDTSNGCAKSETVNVIDSKVLPTAQIANPNNIDCINTTQILDGTGSTTGASITYTWLTSNGGNVTQNGTTLQPTINSGGTYTLVVTNTANSCSATKSVNVTQNTTKPTANAGANKTITCTSNSVVLDGSGSNGPIYQIQWSNAGGNIASSSGGNTYNPTVTQIGIYTLTVKDITNGCTQTANTTVSLDNGVPVANAGPSKEINCNISSVQLDGTGSTPGLTYTWTFNGTPLGQNILQPTVSQPGVYNLEVLNSANGCKGNAQVQVVDNRIKPTLKLAKPVVLNCATPTQILNGTGSSSGANYSYNWSTITGNITSTVFSNITVTINKAGAYTFSIQNSQNGCQKDSTFSVTENFNKPVPSYLPPALLTCTQPTTVIDASGSTKVQNAKITWKSSVANGISSGANTLKPTVNDAGNYTLILKDTLSQCVDSVTITVTKDANIPQANAGPTTQLNCTVKDYILQGSASSGANISYIWTASNGGVIPAGQQNILQPKISAAGKYTLKVVNSTNQCEKESSVDITQDTTKPTIVIAKPAILNCKTTVLSIDANASSSGSNFTNSWFIPAVALVSGGTSLSPLVKAPGTFTLTITNSTNTCQSNKSVTVTQDIVKPQANISNSDTLNCKNASAKLEGTASSNSGYYTFAWNAPVNGIVKDGNTLTPTVNLPGNYQLQVTDTLNYCTATAQISVIKDVVTPNVDAGLGGNITCTVKDLILTGTATNGTAKDFVYTWTTAGGNIVGATNAPAIKVDAPGKYYFAVENKVNGCKSIDSTNVSVDANVPKVEILTSGNLDCKTKSLVLDGTGSSQGAGLSFAWSTKGGSFVGGTPTTLKASINSAGVYILQITNANNNCVKEIEKTILMDTIKPLINVKQDIITCAKPTIELNGAVFQANKYSILWTTSNGNIVTAKNDTLQIQVNKAGFYTLTAKNTDNECESSKLVTVLENKTAPTTLAGADLEINCKDSVVTLQGDKSSKGVDFVYTWTTKNGNILSGDKTPLPPVNAGGTYVLTILDKGNGCSSKDSVLVNINKTLPTITLVKPEILTCKQPQINLVANTTVTGTAQYNWSGGNIIGDKTSSTVVVDKPATYNLTVTDTKNFCVSKTNAVVTQDTIKPKVSAGKDVELNCKNPTLDVQGTATAAQALTYLWTTTNGTIVANADQAKVTVKSAGLYNLLVTNDFNGCSASDVMEVTFLGAPKAVILEPEKLTCTRKSVILDSKGSDSGSNYTYTWSNTNGTTLGTNATLTVTQAGLYNFSVYNTTNECEQKKQINVIEDVAVPGADAGANDVIDCAKGYVILNGNKSSQGNKFAYKWTGGIIENGGNTTTPRVSAQAIYKILVTNTENGCTASDTVSIISLKPALLETTVQDPPCFGLKGSITFKTITGGTPPYLYSIDGGNNFYSASAYKNLKAGDYNVFVQDSKGCTDNDNVTITQPEKLIISINDIDTVAINTDIQLNAKVTPIIPPLKSISWTPDSMLSCKDCLNPIVKAPLNSIYFKLKVVNENGCEADATTYVDVDHTIGVFVPNQFTPNGDNINDRFFVMGDPKLIVGVKWLRVFDRWGDTIYEATDLKPNDNTLGWDGSFRGNPMNPGVFIWNCEVLFIDGRTKILKGDVTINR